MSTFEVVRTEAGWHARFRAANGRIVWTTEPYTRRRAALAAIESILDPCFGWIEGDAIVCLSARDSWNKISRPVAKLVEIDKRQWLDSSP